MTDQHSGSRWEPRPENAPAAPVEGVLLPAARPTGFAGPAAPTAGTTVLAAPPAVGGYWSGLPQSVVAPRRRMGPRRAGGIAAAALGLLLVGGAGGYAVGHATADPATAPAGQQVPQVGTSPGGDGGQGFGRGGFPGGTLPDGTTGGTGTTT